MGFFGNLFDFNRNGKTDPDEQVIEFAVSDEMMEEEEQEEQEEEEAYSIEELDNFDLFEGD